MRIFIRYFVIQCNKRILFVVVVVINYQNLSLDICLLKEMYKSSCTGFTVNEKNKIDQTIEIQFLKNQLH